MKKAFLALALIGSGMALTGCGSSSTSESGSTVDISIPFKAVAGDQTIRCGEDITGLGTAGTDVKVKNFRMYVHDIKLITDQGAEIPVTLDASQDGQNADVALLDFRDTAEGTSVCLENSTDDTEENPNYNDTVKGSADIDPAYTISSIEFTLGVPFDLNHADQTTAEEPLRNPGLASGMAWSWQNGYKFVGFDVIPSGETASWNIHLGSTGCPVGTSDLSAGDEPEECVAPNRPVVTLALEEHDLENLAIKVDYAALVADNNLGEDNGGASGCMSGSTDPECEAIFEKFGLPWGSNEAVEQTVFSVVDGSSN